MEVAILSDLGPDDPCARMDWDPIAASQAYSAFSSVLMGFVFACIVVVATDRQHRDSRNRSNTLVLFLAAFFCLVGASYSSVLISGDVSCARAWTMTLFSDGMLCVGASSVFCGLVWLLHGYTGGPGGQTEHWPSAKFAVAAAFCAMSIAIPLMATTALGYLLDMAVLGDVPAWLTFAVWGLCAAGVVVLSWLFVTRYFGRRRRERSVTAAGTAILIGTLVSLIVMTMATVREEERWTVIPGWLLIISVFFPLLFTVTMLPALMATMPRKPQPGPKSLDETIPIVS